MDKFFMKLLENLANPDMGITFFDVVNTQKELKSTVDIKTISSLFTGLDTSGNGVVVYDEALKFYTQYGFESSAVDPVFWIKATQIKFHLKKDIEQYLLSLDVKSVTELAKEKFYQLSSKIFKTQENAQADMIMA